MTDPTLPGRPSFERARTGRADGSRLWLRPDHAGPDDAPTPLYVLGETNPAANVVGPDLVELDVGDVMWLIDALPQALGALLGIPPEQQEKVLTPDRVRVIEVIARRGRASPNEISVELAEGLGTTAYHVRLLRDFGVLKLAGTKPRRGAIEHFYRLAARPLSAVPAPAQGEAAPDA